MTEHDDKKHKENEEEKSSKQSSRLDKRFHDLTEKLTKIDQDREEALRIAQRAQADYANLKKRFEKEREEISQYASELLLLQFLPAIDNLDRAVFYANEEERQLALYAGVKMTLQQIHDLFQSIGFEQIVAKEGDAFDPHLHEAVEMVAGEQSTIVAALQPGYRLKDKVIRPAQVKVGNGEATR